MLRGKGRGTHNKGLDTRRAGCGHGKLTSLLNSQKGGGEKGVSEDEEDKKALHTRRKP